MKSPKEMTDEELVSACKKFGISTTNYISERTEFLSYPHNNITIEVLKAAIVELQDLAKRIGVSEKEVHYSVECDDYSFKFWAACDTKTWNRAALEEMLTKHIAQKEFEISRLKTLLED